jgi:hypothetical protein
MIPRSPSALMLFASIGLLFAPPGRALPTATPESFTVVQGDVDAVLVSEFGLANGCAEIQVDSIGRRSPTAPGSVLSSAATLYWTAIEPKLDSATGALCQNVRRLRRTDPIPLVQYYPTIPGGTSTVLPMVLRVDPDSVFGCHDGSCSRIMTGIVRNFVDAETCLYGLAAPAPSADSALSWLLDRLATAPAIYLLQRPIQFHLLKYCPSDRPITVWDSGISAAPRAMSTAYGPQESRLRFVGDSWTDWGTLAPVGERWFDSVITGDLALHRSANAGDCFSPETLQFSVQALRAPLLVDPPAKFAYPSGIKTYQYRGWDSTWTCPDGGWSRKASLIGDSLRLEGVSVRLSNDGCGRRGVDVYADKYSRWLFSPPGSGSFVDEFRHGSSAENGASWPVDDDNNIHVRGWAIPLATVRAVASIHSSGHRSSFRAIVRSGALELDLPAASRVDLLDPAGRRLSASDLPAGKASLALGGYHGLLLVQAGVQMARILVP